MTITGLNFIEAVQAAEDGCKIRRVSWGNPACYAAFNCKDLNCSKHLYYTESAQLTTLTREDYLATDWALFSEPPKTMTFQEAVEHLQKHRGVVKRQASRLYMQGSNGILRIFRRGSNGDLDVLLGFDDDIAADDWIAVEEEEQ